jgi:ribosomal protein S18 acetylase RimI-like enzyme
MIIRPCRPTEAEAILDLWRRAESAPSVTADVRHVAALVERGDGSLLVAEADGRIVGSLIAGWDGWRGNIYRLAVLPEYRRRGIALSLVAEGERRLREQGAIRIGAIVLRDHPDAVGFWQAAGYTFQEGVGRFVKTA